MSQENCISIHSLRKRYRSSDIDSLNDVSFSIVKGEKFGIIGPNGAGKTTLISILCGIIPQTSGEFYFYGKENELTLNEKKHQIGFVPQEYAFYEELTPIQNMQYFGSLYNINSKEIALRTDKIFEVLGLTKIATKKTKFFSGGMKRRMNLAIGLVHNPLILFVDEPTVGSDVQSKHAMMAYLNNLNAQGTTIIYSSHHMSEAEEFCQRIAFINKGKLVACDHVQTLLHTHKAKDLQSLFINLTGEGYFDGYE